MSKAKLQTTTPHAMDEIIESSEGAKVPQVGGLVEAVVISIGKREVRLDVPGFTSGVVRGRELSDESGEFNSLKVGNKVTATVLELENENGELELSFREAGHQKAWDKLNALKKSGEIISVKVVDANKGGLMVKLGEIPGFLPVSQLTVEHYPRVEGGDKSRILEILKRFAGQTMEAKVMTVDEENEKLIVSERAAWEEQQKGKLDLYHVGDTVTGKISGVVDFGCFVEFGEGLEGLVHISELAWQRIENPRDVVKTGDNVKAKIINIDGSKISLSLRRLQDDPWKIVGEKYKIGDKLTGKVIKVNPFGAFVELDNEIHGLAHVSELADKSVQDASEIVKVGEVREFRIISMDPGEHRLGLSLKEPSKKSDPVKSSDDDHGASKKKKKDKAEEKKTETVETVETKVEEKMEEVKE